MGIAGGRHMAGFVIASVLRGAGAVSREVSRARDRGVLTCVYFHQPTAAAFRGCAVWLLKAGYTPVSSAQVEEAIYGGRALPELPVHISLDDAWRSNLTEVIPVVRELDLPITLFVPTEAIVSGHYWWTGVERACGDGGRTAERMKALPDDERRRRVAALGPGADRPREAMTLDELRQVAGLGQVTIGSHTVSHPILVRCSDAVLDDEIGRSREILEDWLGRPVTTFSYPNGDADRRTLDCVRRHGYRLAFTTRQAHGRLQVADAAGLPRFAVLNDGWRAENIARASGAWARLFHH